MPVLVVICHRRKSYKVKWRKNREGGNYGVKLIIRNAFRLFLTRHVLCGVSVPRRMKRFRKTVFFDGSRSAWNARKHRRKTVTAFVSPSIRLFRFTIIITIIRAHRFQNGCKTARPGPSRRRCRRRRA